MKIIYVAGGCFWGVEAYYKKLKGIIDTECGYANGNSINPSYEDLKKHIATHAETVKIVYDENVISLTKILEHFLRIVDPYEINHQGEDYGIQYRKAIYYVNENEEKVIIDYFDSIEKSKPFAIQIEKLDAFYDAESYHQDYLDNNPNGYCHVNFNLIRDDERK